MLLPCLTVSVAQQQQRQQSRRASADFRATTALDLCLDLLGAIKEMITIIIQTENLITSVSTFTPTHPPTQGRSIWRKSLDQKKEKEKERNGFRQPARVSVWQNRAEERVTESKRVKGLTIESRGSQGGTDSEGKRESERKRRCTCPGCDSFLNLWRAPLNRQWKLQQM